MHMWYNIQNYELERHEMSILKKQTSKNTKAPSKATKGAKAEPRKAAKQSKLKKAKKTVGTGGFWVL